jgi:hypothetical protein
VKSTASARLVAGYEPPTRWKQPRDHDLLRLADATLDAFVANPVDVIGHVDRMRALWWDVSAGEAVRPWRSRRDMVCDRRVGVAETSDHGGAELRLPVEGAQPL